MKRLAMKRLVLMLGVLGFICSAFAGNITVTAPAKGTVGTPTLVGASTDVKFNLLATQPGATEITVTVTIRKVSDNSIVTISPGTRLTPDNDGKASGQYQMTFTRGVNEEVPYKVEVRAVELGRTGEIYNTDQDLFVSPDLTRPKILQFNPSAASFVKGTVPITVQIEEPNLKDWRVQVNNQDIPNNTGTTVNSNGVFVVNWNTTGIPQDGAKTITFKIRDKGDNETTLNVDVTVDRNAPTVLIATPRSGSVISPGTYINVIVDITDFSGSSVDVTGVDIVARKLDNTYVTRVARISFQQTSQTGRRWSGRIKWRAGLLPSDFKIIATVVDRAGNVATAQSVTVRIGP